MMTALRGGDDGGGGASLCVEEGGGGDGEDGAGGRWVVRAKKAISFRNLPAQGSVP